MKLAIISSQTDLGFTSQFPTECDCFKKRKWITHQLSLDGGFPQQRVSDAENFSMSWRLCFPLPTKSEISFVWQVHIDDLEVNYDISNTYVLEIS